MSIEEIIIGTKVLEKDKSGDITFSESRITNKTSNSVEVYITAKTSEGVDCYQWFRIKDFENRFKMV